MKNGNSDKPLLLMMLLPIVVCTPELSQLGMETQMSPVACIVCKCHDTIVNCSDRGLTNITIPMDIPTDTKSLYLSGNQLGALGSRLFTKFTKLEKLILFNSSITRLSNGTFDGLSNLQELDISCNEPLSLTNETTPIGLFRQLKKLKILKMYGNVGTYNYHYNYIDTQLSSMTQLEELWIDGFTQKPFGKGYQHLTSLKTLHIAGDHIPKSWRRPEFCRIEKLAAPFLENLIHVEKFTIKHCGIETIDEKAFGKLQSLQYLDLSYNQHLNLPSAFGSLCYLTNSKLTTLFMNRMGSHQRGDCGVHLTIEMTKCLQKTRLQELHIDYNRMSFIELNALKYLPKSLKIVTAEGNEFEPGLYIFETFELSNITSISIPYQGYINDVSIWHKGKKDTIYPKSAAVLDNYYYFSDNESDVEDEQLQSYTNRPSGALDEHYPDMFSMLEDLKHILGSKRYGYAIRRDEREPNSTVKDHRVCPQLTNGNYIPPTTITVFLPPLLTDLDLSYSRLGSPIFEMFVNESNSIKLINVSNSMLYCWDGPIHGLTKLEYLDLSYNFCENVSSRMFEGLNNLKYLNMGYNFLSKSILNDKEGTILDNLVDLRILELQFNNIYQIPRVFFKSLISLEKLNLSGNSLDSFNVEIGHMTKLKYLDLRSNRITTLSLNTRETFNAIAARSGSNTRCKALSVDLRYNAVHCSCNNMDFMKWAFQNYGIKCNDSLTVKLSTCDFLDNQKVANLTNREEFGDVLDDLEDSCRSYTLIIACVSVLIAVIITILVAVTVHSYRWRLQYWYFVNLRGYSCSRCNQQSRQGYIEIRDNSEYIYDAYVASCDDQNDFNIYKLRAECKKHSLRTFLQAIHIKPGSFLANVIGNTIHQSRVVVFIFFEGWFSNQEMKTAYYMWQYDKVQRDSPYVIGVKLGELHGDDLGIIRKIHADVFIDYPRDADEQDINEFWTTLVQTIRSRGN